MKYKFHEDSPSYDPNGEVWANKESYIKEINWIAKNKWLDVNKFKVDDFTFGEPVVFYDGKYFGYLDAMFYYYFDTEDWDGYWDFDN